MEKMQKSRKQALGALQAPVDTPRKPRRPRKPRKLAPIAPLAPLPPYLEPCVSAEIRACVAPDSSATGPLLEVTQWARWAVGAAGAMKPKLSADDADSVTFTHSDRGPFRITTYAHAEALLTRDGAQPHQSMRALERHARLVRVYPSNAPSYIALRHYESDVLRFERARRVVRVQLDGWYTYGVITEIDRVLSAYVFTLQWVGSILYMRVNLGLRTDALDWYHNYFSDLYREYSPRIAQLDAVTALANPSAMHPYWTYSPLRVLVETRDATTATHGKQGRFDLGAIVGDPQPSARSVPIWVPYTEGVEIDLVTLCVTPESVARINDARAEAARALYLLRSVSRLVRRYGTREQRDHLAWQEAVEGKTCAQCAVGEFTPAHVTEHFITSTLTTPLLQHIGVRLWDGLLLVQRDRLRRYGGESQFVECDPVERLIDHDGLRKVLRDYIRYYLTDAPIMARGSSLLRAGNMWVNPSTPRLHRLRGEPFLYDVAHPSGADFWRAVPDLADQSDLPAVSPASGEERSHAHVEA